MALVKGQWQGSKILVEKSLRKFELESGERRVCLDTQGKPSKTVFYPKKVYQQATLVDVALYTGRTHQIRVHAKGEGHELAGDTKYGDELFNQQMKQKGLARMFLHAKQVKFTLPDGQNIDVKANLDNDLTQFLKVLDETL